MFLSTLLVLLYYIHTSVASSWLAMLFQNRRRNLAISLHNGVRAPITLLLKSLEMNKYDVGGGSILKANGMNSRKLVIQFTS